MVMTREKAKVWIGMTPEQRELTNIPEENYDVVEAYANGKDVYYQGKFTRANCQLSFDGKRKNYEIIDPKWKPKGDSYLFTTRSTFHTKGECDKVKKATNFYIKLWQLALELNDGWEPDWNDFKNPKYCLFFDHDAGEWCFETLFAINNLTPVFKSKEVAKKAIEIIERGDLD
jgi:hypothetical protein